MSDIHQEQSPLDLPLGEVVRLPCKFIEGQSSTSPVLIKHLVKQLQSSQKNILPVIVKSLGQNDYEAVLNLQILEASRAANLDFIYCIVVDEQMLAAVNLEAGKKISVDISIASEEEICDALEFLKSRSPELKKMDPQKAARGIIDHRTLREIQSLSFLTTLGCGIGKAKLPLVVEILKYPKPITPVLTVQKPTRKSTSKRKTKV
jgi:hypothetical protein